MTTPDPATLREALAVIDGWDIRQNSPIISAARWALELIEGDEHEHCDDCGRAYPDVYSLPDDLWARIHERAPAGLLCPTCALARIVKLLEGGKEVWWCAVGEEDDCGLVRGPPQEWCELARERFSTGRFHNSKLAAAHAECGKRLLVEA